MELQKSDLHSQVHSLTDRIDMMITKETELQEECTQLAKTNNQLNE